MTIERMENRKEEVLEISTLSVGEALRKLDNLIQDNKEIFSNQIGQVNHYRHQIRAQDIRPYKSKTYPIPHVYMDKMCIKIREYIKKLENHIEANDAIYQSVSDGS